MNISFAKSERGNNTGSCSKLIEYLDKENEKKQPEEYRLFFTSDRDDVISKDVIEDIDSKKRKLGKKDAKFYMLTINPSQKELKHIGCSEEKLKAYTREIMEKYAANFNKGLQSKDLVWYAKIEENRTDRQSKRVKEGLNWHVHVVVARRDREQRYKLSPLTHHRNSKEGVIKGGFDRNTVREESEKLFDKMFDYHRQYKDSWEYQNAIKNGKAADKVLVSDRALMFEKGISWLQDVAKHLPEKQGNEQELEELMRKKQLKKEKKRNRGMSR